MPIDASPSGTLDIENATLRSREIVALTNMVAGNDVVRSDGPALEVFGDPGPRLELVSNTEATDGTATFTRLESNVGVFSIQSGTDGSTNGPITFGGFSNERMRITADGKVGIGTDSPTTKFTLFGDTTENEGGLLMKVVDDVSLDNGFTGIGLGGYSTASTQVAKSAIIHERNAFYGRGNLMFCNSDTNDATDVSNTHARMTITPTGNVGIGVTNPQYTLDVNGLASSKTSRVFEFTGGDNYARHFWICSFLDAPGYHTNQLIKINYSVTYKRLTGSHSRNSIASGTVTFSDLWRYSTDGNPLEQQFVTLQDQKNELYYGQGRIPKWYYVRFNNRGYLVLSTSISDANSAGYYIKGNVDFLTRPTAESVDRIFNGTVYKDSSVAQTEGFTSISDLYPTTGTDVDGWDSAMSSGSSAQNLVEATEGTIFKHGKVGIGKTNPSYRLDVVGTSADSFGNIAYFFNSNGSGRLGIRDERSSPYIPPGIWTGSGGGLAIGAENGPINFYTANQQLRMYIQADGVVKLANGNVVSSDDRIKYNEVDIPNALTLISQLKPQKYEKLSLMTGSGTWIPTDEEWENVKSEYQHTNEFGFIAQDIKKIPELSFLVTGEETEMKEEYVIHEQYSNLTTEEQNTYTAMYIYDDNIITQEEYSNLPPEAQEVYGKRYIRQIETQTPLALNYQGLFVVAIGAIKELKAKNDDLEARITALESA